VVDAGTGSPVMESEVHPATSLRLAEEFKTEPQNIEYRMTNVEGKNRSIKLMII
jgi:hypothetical protein